MAGAKLTDVKLVLSAPVGFKTRRKAIMDLEMAYVSSRNNFLWRATPATWAASVTAARRLHAAVKAEQDRLDKSAPGGQLAGLGEDRA